MTEARFNGLESRMDRLEEVLSSAGEFLLQASALAQQNTVAIDRLTERIDQNVVAIDRLTERIDRNAAAIDRLTERVDSLTAASERHDRILDYLLSREANDNR